MINPSCSTGSCTNSDSLMPEEHVCKTPTPNNLDVLLEIIKENKHHRHMGIKSDIYEKSPFLMDASCVVVYNKWSLKICEEFESIIDELLNSFANKLAQINCGHADEKVLFLSEISKNIATHPFCKINRSIEHTIVIKIKDAVNYYSEEKRKILINTGSKDYNDMKKIILESAEKILSDESIILELTKYISDEFHSVHKRNYLKETIDYYVNIDMRENVLAEFKDLYVSHIEENYGCIISKYIDIFNSLVKDKECHMSFAFDTIFGQMVYYKNAERLCNIIHGSIKSKVKLKNLISSGEIKIFDCTQEGNFYTRNCFRYSDELKEFFSDSEKKLREKIEQLTESDIIILDGDVITTWKKEFREKLISSAVRYLRLELHSCFDVK
ncbi:hypothetical protein [Candidatus Ichthyocystis hellenicum]|uniref:hypothetical protein n=1 Tax=Candidatus Ichthyocystis hellenicum TaxID=1561003 RepID=UPI001111C1E7|nr:hypothetical protein [Candidatus Ichthyocystis hellenicum]